jgi:nicotinate phosphoribosyltransferase
MNIFEHAPTSLVTDLYELTMMQGYYRYRRTETAVFDMFYRTQPFGGGYAVFAGLEPMIAAVLDFRFGPAELDYLAGLKLFQPDFLAYLAELRFRGDIDAVDEGEIVFPREPLVRVTANIIEAQMIESVLLNIVNFQTLIATKTARIVTAAEGRAVSEFGLRRAQGIDGALSAARAAYIGGASSTSNLLAGKTFGIPVQGTMAHSWIMSFGSERRAFAAFAELYPEHTVLLVDTYDTLGKGMPAAIPVLQGLKRKGMRHFGVRLDSGDLENLSKQVRRMLDRAGLAEAVIVASNELDEYVIEELVRRGAPIDVFGVGTRLVTGYNDPALNGIYKLVARRQGGRYAPGIKLSDNPAKVTSPHVKNVLRFYGAADAPQGDMVLLESERRRYERQARQRAAITMYHPDYSYETRRMRGYRSALMMLHRVVAGGRVRAPFPGLSAMRAATQRRLAALPPPYRRLLNPHVYGVSITRKLRDIKISLIRKYR